ncbi:MAG: LysR family transcriptional regulator [Thiohalomonadales bacterium]
MHLTLEALTVIDAIDRNGSFASAAFEMHRVPSAITYTIQKLESDFDLELFNRDGHRAVLTDSGKKLLQEGRHILRAALELEQNMKRVATGWETELRIAVVDLIPLTRIYPLIHQFQHVNTGTVVNLSREVFGGTWDALAWDRADLVIGAIGDAPAGTNFTTRLMGNLDLVFVVAPHHPLATINKPLVIDDILAHRAIAAADSSRKMTPRTLALLRGQSVMTVPDMDSKIEAQRQGLGVGYIPKNLIEHDLLSGALIVKEIENAPPIIQLYIAWRTQDSGNALKWFQEKLTPRIMLDYLLGEADIPQSIIDPSTDKK